MNTKSTQTTSDGRIKKIFIIFPCVIALLALVTISWSSYRQRQVMDPAYLAKIEARYKALDWQIHNFGLPQHMHAEYSRLAAEVAYVKAKQQQHNSEKNNK